MRTAGDLSGLAVVGEGSGSKLGKIQDVLFDPISGDITGFLVHPGGLFTKAQFLPRLAVRALGTDALMAEQGHVLQEITSEPVLSGSVSAGSLSGRPILDDAGRVLGKMTDAVLAETELSIQALQYSGGVLNAMLHGKAIIPLTVVKAIGADSIVVPASYLADAEKPEATEPRQP